jgi:hypothetical protein
MLAYFPSRFGFMFALWLAVPTITLAAGESEKAYQQAQRQVAAGDLAAARRSMITAVKAERSNQQYLQQYLLISQALKLEAAVQTQRDPERWESAAQALSLFYTSQGHPARALPVDQAIFDRLQTAESAVQLAETLLSLDEAAGAAGVLRTLPAERTTTASSAMLCVALARAGEMDEAKRVGTALRAGSADDPFTLYLAARAQAVTGEADRSMATLTRCFESVPPSRLDALKSHSRTCPDFAGVASSAVFARVQQTESKVPESKCSGGSSCSTCPMRGNCSHGK